MLNPSWLKASTALETSILGVLSSVNSGIGGGGGNPDAAILALFAAGEKGVWLDRSDLSTMFQDLTNTTPAVVDSPVGHCRDKSGNGAHWTAFNSASRPILRLTSGVYWLQWDGVDDRGTTVAIDFSAVDEMTAFVGARKLGETSQYIYMLGPDISASAGIAMSITNFGTPSIWVVSRGTATTSAGASSAGYAAPFTFVATHRTNISADTNLLRVNGVDVATSAADQGAGNYLNAALTIGSYAGAGGGAYYSGRDNQVILRGKTSTLAEYTAVEAWISAKIGSPF